MGESNSATQAYLSSSPSSPPAPPALPPTPLPPLLGAAVCDPHAAVLLPATPPSRGGRGARPRARCFDLFPPLSFASFPSSFISSVVSFLSVIQLRTVCLLFSPPPACLPSFALSLLSCSLPPTYHVAQRWCSGLRSAHRHYTARHSLKNKKRKRETGGKCRLFYHLCGGCPKMAVLLFLF